LNASEKEQLRECLHQALSETLRELRERRPGKPSQEALADEIGMDRSYWGDLERGERSLTLYNLWRIAQALRVSPSRLVLDIDRRYRELCAPREKTPGPKFFKAELKKLRAFMDQAPSMKWFADRDQKNAYCNPPLLEFMGCTLEQVAGAGWRNFVHPADLERYEAVSAKPYARREPYVAQYRIRRASGEYVWMAQQAVPQFTAKGVFLGFLGIMIPIPDSLAASMNQKNGC
jgi:PAS domain S-box-containing protein